MKIGLRKIENVNILDIYGRIDINCSEIIEISSQIVKAGQPNIIFNLENVEQIDYNGLSVLAISYKNVINHGGNLKLCNVPLQIMELFRVVRLDSVFSIYQKEQSAILSFHNKDIEIEEKLLRRRFERIGIHLENKYWRVGLETKQYKGTILNISGAGLYLYAKDTLPLHSEVAIELWLPEQNKPLLITGTVIWLADKEIQLHVYPGMGISLVDLEHTKQKAIVDFVEKNASHRSNINPAA